jgi:hypothetical protein
MAIVFLINAGMVCSVMIYASKCENYHGGYYLRCKNMGCCLKKIYIEVHFFESLNVSCHVFLRCFMCFCMEMDFIQTSLSTNLSLPTLIEIKDKIMEKI